MTETLRAPQRLLAAAAVLALLSSSRMAAAQDGPVGPTGALQLPSTIRPAGIEPIALPLAETRNSSNSARPGECLSPIKILQEYDFLDAFTQALLVTGMSSDLDPPRAPVTIIAPTNVGFANLLAAIDIEGEDLVNDPAAMRHILAVHLSPEFVDKDALTEGQMISTFDLATPLYVQGSSDTEAFLLSGGEQAAKVLSVDINRGICPNVNIIVVDGAIVPVGFNRKSVGGVSEADAVDDATAAAAAGGLFGGASLPSGPFFEGLAAGVSSAGGDATNLDAEPAAETSATAAAGAFPGFGGFPGAAAGGSPFSGGAFGGFASPFAASGATAAETAGSPEAADAAAFPLPPFLSAFFPPSTSTSGLPAGVAGGAAGSVPGFPAASAGGAADPYAGIFTGAFPAGAAAAAGDPASLFPGAGTFPGSTSGADTATGAAELFSSFFPAGGVFPGAAGFAAPAAGGAIAPQGAGAGGPVAAATQPLPAAVGAAAGSP